MKGTDLVTLEMDFCVPESLTEQLARHSNIWVRFPDPGNYPHGLVVLHGRFDDIVACLEDVWGMEEEDAVCLAEVQPE